MSETNTLLHAVDRLLRPPQYPVRIECSVFTPDLIPAFNHKVPINDGSYTLVHVQPENGVWDLTWYDEANGSTVAEHSGKEKIPYNAVHFDCDGTVFDSEERGGFFDAAWAELFHDAGIAGSVKDVNDLRWQVYRWNSTVIQSTFDMLDRIEQGIDIRGNRLPEHAQEVLNKLRNREWVQEIAGEAPIDLDNVIQVAAVLADHKELLGAQILLNNPKLIDTLAPLMPGFSDFIHHIPPQIPLSIASASRRETILIPFIQAYDDVHPKAGLGKRFDILIGEKESNGALKPERRFYWSVITKTGRAAFDSGKFDITRKYATEDALFIGNNHQIDLPHITGDHPKPDRREMYHLLVNPAYEKSNFGPKTATVSGFPALLEMKRNYHGEVIRPTLSRLLQTMT